MGCSVTGQILDLIHLNLATFCGLAEASGAIASWYDEFVEPSSSSVVGQHLASFLGTVLFVGYSSRMLGEHVAPLTAFL